MKFIKDHTSKDEIKREIEKLKIGKEKMTEIKEMPDYASEIIDYLFKFDAIMNNEFDAHAPELSTVIHDSLMSSVTFGAMRIAGLILYREGYASGEWEAQKKLLRLCLERKEG